MKNAIKNAGKNTSLAGPKGVYLQLKLVFMSQIKYDWHGKIERAYFLPISYVNGLGYISKSGRDIGTSSSVPQLAGINVNSIDNCLATRLAWSRISFHAYNTE